MRHDDYVAWAGTSVAVIPMIETTEALGNLDDIMSVPGVDAIYVGPADLSLSLGLKPRNNDGEAVFDDALAAIVDACGRHGVVPGIHASGALAGKRLGAGFPDDHDCERPVGLAQRSRRRARRRPARPMPTAPTPRRRTETKVPGAMEALRTAVEDAVGQRVEAMAVVRGGDVAASFRVELDDGRRLFAKTHPSAPPGFFTHRGGEPGVAP